MTLHSCKNEKQVDKSNPFFSEFNTPFNVPAFDKIMAKHYMPAFDTGMAQGRREIAQIVKNKKNPTFKNTVVALDNAGELLTNVSKVFFEQASANTNDSLQNIEVEISPKLAAFNDEITLNPDLFKRVKYVYDNQTKFKLNPEQTFLLENLYKGFIRNGANLNKQDQDSLKKLNQQISVLAVRFSQNILNETNDYNLFVDKSGIDGLPESVTAPAADAAKAAGQEGKWLFTTQKPSIFPFLTYSKNRELRRELFHAYTNRGNNGNESDNNKVFAELVALRAAHAKILGFKSHADYVLELRMAKNPENVANLLNSLWERAIPLAKNEVKEMQDIINKEGGKFKLEPSDWWYYSEKLRKQKYDLNDTELRPYFKLENVIDGVLTCANKLFGITFTPLTKIPLPHPDAKAFEVKDNNGLHIGVLYMDFHPRESKRQGAWCGTYRSHHMKDGKIITPVVTSVFNFTSPNGDMPALLDLDEVSTLFHEFGHALDNLFNKNQYNSLYVPSDFVELPSQLNEHWATEPAVLKMYAKNYKTGELIPDELVKKITNSGYFNQGFANVEVLAASMLDMAYHTLQAPVNIDIQSFEKDYFTKIGLIPEIVSRYRTTYFAHIADGYDAGYYCYTWAAVLDNDAFEAFKEKGIFDQATAQSYRKNILEKDGTMDAMQMFVNFRGREPKIEPLLKNTGLMN
jgi:peptidyl-dipeptidase Dcp